MKKFFTVLLLFIIAAILCIYIFIPSNITVSAVTVANAPAGSVYRYVNTMNDYAMKSGALITDNPMYNVTTLEKDTVRLMVALPVNKSLQQNNFISPIKMVPGNFLITQVSGGEGTVKNALIQLQNFV